MLEAARRSRPSGTVMGPEGPLGGGGGGGVGDQRRGTKWQEGSQHPRNTIPCPNSMKKLHLQGQAANGTAKSHGSRRCGNRSAYLGPARCASRGQRGGPRHSRETAGDRRFTAGPGRCPPGAVEFLRGSPGVRPVLLPPEARAPHRRSTPRAQRTVHWDPNGSVRWTRHSVDTGGIANGEMWQTRSHRGGGGGLHPETHIRKPIGDLHDPGGGPKDTASVGGRGAP